MAFNGPKKAFIYYLDDGTYTVIRRDESNSEIAGLGGVEWDPVSPILGMDGTGTASPANLARIQRFKPRYVNWQSLDGSKTRKLVCFNPQATLWASTTSSLTVDAEVGLTTGRVGEKITYA
jgi:hypothetical protein